MLQILIQNTERGVFHRQINKIRQMFSKNLYWNSCLSNLRVHWHDHWKSTYNCHRFVVCAEKTNLLMWRSRRLSWAAVACRSGMMIRTLWFQLDSSISRSFLLHIYIVTCLPRKSHLKEKIYIYLRTLLVNRSPIY